MRIIEFVAKMKEARLLGRKKIEKALVGISYPLDSTDKLTPQIVMGLMEFGTIPMSEFAAYIDDLLIITGNEKLADIFENKYESCFTKLEAILSGYALCDLTSTRVQKLSARHHDAQADLAGLVVVYLNKMK